MLQFPLGSNLFPEPNNFRAGGHREAVIPVPIPNTEVKGFIAEGSVGPAHARVGRRRPFFYTKKKPVVILLSARLSLRSACLLPHGSQTPARGGYAGLFLWSDGRIV